MECTLNLLLNFESYFTTARYEKEMTERLNCQIICFILFSEAAWIGCYLFFPDFGLQRMLIGSLCLFICIIIICTKSSLTLLRAVYGLVEILFIYYAYQTNLCVSTLLMLTSIEFVANLICLICWYRHLILSIIRGLLCSVYFNFFSIQRFSLYGIDLVMILASTLLFWSIDKFIKENWLRLDNSRKTQNTMTKLSDSIPEPIFLVDLMGIILYQNRSGEDLAVHQAINIRKNIMSIIAEEDQQALAHSIKAVNREGRQSLIVKVPLELKSNILEIENNIEHDKAIQSQIYKLKLDRFAWKGHNCVLIHCYDITEIMMICEMNLINQYRMRNKIEAIKLKFLETIKSMPKHKVHLTRMLSEEAQIYFFNEQSISITKNFLLRSEIDEEYFVLDNFLMYFMEIHNFLALSKNVHLYLNTDPCNPKELGTNRRQLEILLSAFLSFIIEHESPNETVTLHVTLKELQNGCYLMSFSFIFSCNEVLSFSVFNSLVSKLIDFQGRHIAEKYELVKQFGFSLVNAGEVLALLGGKVEVNISQNQKINLQFNLPFSCVSEDKSFTTFISVGVFELERVSKYSIRWGKPKTVGEEISSEACKVTSGFSEVIENEEKKKEAQEISKEKLIASIKRKHMWKRSKSTMLQNNTPENNAQDKAQNEDTLLESNFPSFEENQECSTKSRQLKQLYFGEPSPILLASNHKKEQSKPHYKQNKSQYSIKRKLSQSLFSRQYQESILPSTTFHKWVKVEGISKTKSHFSEEFKQIYPKVLIVEDNVFNILPIKNILGKNNIEFDVAKNGIMAVERYMRAMNEGVRYGAILMDIEMPIKNGYEATEEIRKIEASNCFPHTYICGLSAASDHGVETRCLSCGMDQYIPKPINMEVMLKIILSQFESIVPSKFQLSAPFTVMEQTRLRMKD